MGLRVACSCEIAGEKRRYPPFVAALNEILLHCRKLKSRGDTLNDGDIIFSLNGRAVIEAYHLAERKPEPTRRKVQKFVRHARPRWLYIRRA